MMNKNKDHKIAKISVAASVATIACTVAANSSASGSQVQEKTILIDEYGAVSTHGIDFYTGSKEDLLRKMASLDKRLALACGVNINIYRCG